MTEPEVSIRLALYYIENCMTKETVRVSIDGAHIKTGSTIHFPIESFLEQMGCVKQSQDGKWQGYYAIPGSDVQIAISSTPGVGDVVVNLDNGTTVYAECKKGRSNRSGQEYPLMREAIGQLMTGTVITDNMIPVVAIPYSSKSFELATRWSALDQMKKVGIQFALVHDDGAVDFIR